MIQVTEQIALADSELSFDFIRASGPGGQNVNKVASAVQLRFDVDGSPSLPDDVRERLKKLAGSRLSGEGVLIITARRFRMQERNRKDAVDRLVELIQRAAERPKKRRKTHKTRASEERRLKNKKRRAETKRLRGRGPSADD